MPAICTLSMYFFLSSVADGSENQKEGVWGVGHQKFFIAQTRDLKTFFWYQGFRPHWSLNNTKDEPSIFTDSVWLFFLFYERYPALLINLLFHLKFIAQQIQGQHSQAPHKSNMADIKKTPIDAPQCISPMSPLTLTSNSTASWRTLACVKWKQTWYCRLDRPPVISAAFSPSPALLWGRSVPCHN